MAIDKALEELKAKYVKAFPFKTMLDFEVWSNQVYSLLAFDIELSTRFRSHTDDACVSWRLAKQDDASAYIKRSAEVLDQAIERAKQLTPPVAERLIEAEAKMPKEITLDWLIRHVSIRQWIFMLSIVVSAFVVGVWVGQSQFYAHVRQSLSENR